MPMPSKTSCLYTQVPRRHHRPTARSRRKTDEMATSDYDTRIAKSTASRSSSSLWIFLRGSAGRRRGRMSRRLDAFGWKSAFCRPAQSPVARLRDRLLHWYRHGLPDPDPHPRYRHEKARIRSDLGPHSSDTSTPISTACLGAPAILRRMLPTSAARRTRRHRRRRSAAPVSPRQLLPAVLTLTIGCRPGG